MGERREFSGYLESETIASSKPAVRAQDEYRVVVEWTMHHTASTEPIQ